MHRTITSLKTVLVLALTIVLGAQPVLADDDDDRRHAPGLSAQDQVEDLPVCYALGTDALGRAVNAIGDQPLDSTANLADPDFAEGLAFYRKCFAKGFSFTLAFDGNPVLTVPDPATRTNATDAALEPAPSEQAGSEPGTASDSEAVIVTSVEQTQAEPSQDSVALAQLSPARRFQQELETSARWIRQHEDSVGTIQILLLSYDGFKPEVYYDFVDRLASRQVDIEQLRIFKTLTGKAEVYSVVYGQYPSRRDALAAIKSLPEALRETGPIPRSVGGLWQEIRRLDAEN